jgi:hypothetical protein
MGDWWRRPKRLLFLPHPRPLPEGGENLSLSGGLTPIGVGRRARDYRESRGRRQTTGVTSLVSGGPMLSSASLYRAMQPWIAALGITSCPAAVGALDAIPLT